MIRAFTPQDRDAMLAFAQALPEHDLMFLGRDISHPRVIDAWAAAIAEGTIDSLIAQDDTGTVVATAALVRDPLGWSRHVGEVRLLVAPDRRGQGHGRALLEAIFRIAVNHGLTKLSARMTPDQRAAIELFETVGFRGEALLKDQLIDRQGELHDLAILSLDIGRGAARHAAYGIDDE